MSHSSYTASERRGVLAIALLSILIIAGGFLFSHCNRGISSGNNDPVVIESKSFVDSVAIERAKGKENSKNKNKNKNKKTRTGSSQSKKTQKTLRKRSPLDEPV